MAADRLRTLFLRWMRMRLCRSVRCSAQPVGSLEPGTCIDGHARSPWQCVYISSAHPSSTSAPFPSPVSSNSLALSVWSSLRLESQYSSTILKRLPIASVPRASSGRQDCLQPRALRPWAASCFFPTRVGCPDSSTRAGFAVEHGDYGAVAVARGGGLLPLFPRCFLAAEHCAGQRQRAAVLCFA